MDYIALLEKADNSARLETTNASKRVDFLNEAVEMAAQEGVEKDAFYTAFVETATHLYDKLSSRKGYGSQLAKLVVSMQDNKAETLETYVESFYIYKGQERVLYDGKISAPSIASALAKKTVAPAAPVAPVADDGDGSRGTVAKAKISLDDVQAFIRDMVDNGEFDKVDELLVQWASDLNAVRTAEEEVAASA